MLNKFNPFWIFSIAVFCALLMPSLVQDGMFMDGVLYSSVAKNLAHDRGTFWFPYFSATTHTFFHEQPPLIFGIQSLFFRLMGDSIYTERFYSFLMACINGGLIHLVWKEFFRESDFKNLSWLPFFLWITIPVCFWSFQNNMQENTMSVFTLSATLFILKGIRQNK